VADIDRTTAPYHHRLATGLVVGRRRSPHRRHPARRRRSTGGARLDGRFPRLMTAFPTPIAAFARSITALA
jgi:hypothetical protein